MTQETLEKIKKLRLFGMARAYETSLEMTNCPVSQQMN